MTPILQALTDAARVGFDAQPCRSCPYRGPAAVGPCSVCEGTGLDASDPERLIGRAERWLLARESYPRIWTFPASVVYFWTDASGKERDVSALHDNTAGSHATALLRLVARVGAPRKTS